MAIEKLAKARQSLIPHQRSVELASSRERLAYANLAVCTRGGIFSVNKAFACNDASWQGQQRTKEVIEAEDQYAQGRKAFEEVFKQGSQTCLFEPE